MFSAGEYDVAVVGAGHAGIEAALAAARLGARVVCFAINIDSIGNMPCNPAIGGTGKGHLVREIDALGGEMARLADSAAMQYRTLNRAKGPAVRSLRVQCDRREYQKNAKAVLERQPGLSVRQAEITKIVFENETGAVCGVMTHTGAVYAARAVVVASGTYLSGKTIIGDVTRTSGPDGIFGANELGLQLKSLGLRVRRFKTGTPPRVNARSIDFTQTEIQRGDNNPQPCAFEHSPGAIINVSPVRNNAVCHLTYTNEITHSIIRQNLSRSPLFSGAIEGTGPRYCPSIEDKVVRFADKQRHQLFLEPTGADTEEIYIQGFSSSMPEDIQIEMLRSVAGLQKADIQRSAYAIEYDCIDPTELHATLEVKKIPGLFCAGQVNGTSGYEEAAAQGLIAGINAAKRVTGGESIVLTRHDGYIGTMIDDLTARGTDEPYRVMTSRTEYRLLFRQDNADRRLAHLGYKAGLVSRERIDAVNAKYGAIEREIARLNSAHIGTTAMLREMLESKAEPVPSSGTSLAALLKRPGITYTDLAPFDNDYQILPVQITASAEIEIKYEGYLKRAERELFELRRLEESKLPEEIDYNAITGIRIEARQKLSAARPATLGGAMRIPGVSPADAALLMAVISKRN